MTLLKCESEEEVIKVLKKLDYWNNRECWTPYGQISNNRGVVSNQQSSPVAALVEKLVNSIDAILVSECFRKKIDPVSNAAPSNMNQAIELLLGIKGGSIANIDSRSRTPYAERIQLITTGTKTEPNYLIIDDGEGQNPKDFPNTFLSLLRENKTKIPFVQGKFNMGGTGVFQFSGKNSFQLIISKRQIDLPNADNKWGFTIVRRIEPEANQPYSSYVYLAPNKEILSFDEEFILVNPGQYPYLYSESLVYGTCIKLWNYKLQGSLKSLSTLNLRWELEKFLPDPAIPIRVKERRSGFRAHTFETTMSGLLSVISDGPDKIETGLDTGTPLNIPNVGNVQLRVVLFKEESNVERMPAGVFFIVNGQLHGELDEHYVSRKTKMDYIAGSLVVLADCTTLPSRVREDLFLASRDRMRLCDEKTALEEAIIEYIKEHPGLKEINIRRRQARMTKGSEEETLKIIQNLVRSDPTLANLFGKGKDINIPIGKLPEPIPYEGKKFPTFFRIINEPKDGLIKKCPKNRTTKIEFETDAINDYFSRGNDAGRISIIGTPSLKSLHLWNGKATVRFSIPDSCQVGDKYNIETEVSDISRAIPFKSNFIIEVIPEVIEKEPPEPHIKQSGKIAIPDIKDVYRNDWLKYGFDEKTAIDIKYNEKGEFDWYINMDNIYLINEIGRRRDINPDNLRYIFKYGLFFLLVGMIFQLQTENEKKEGDEEINFDIIKDSAKGLAVTLIPVLLQITKGKI
ncbi:MAG: hypothetical protein A2X08_18320 [Bacteroidetes bacterium GWA2_32_17]|nr:MAG: hypothetical protein A2X08_18320 [Bacteroidetes bacterium GWA2_32_17]